MPEAKLTKIESAKRLASRGGGLGAAVLALFGANVLPAAGQEHSVSAIEAAVKKPRPPESFAANHLRVPAEQIEKQRASDLTLAITTNTDGETVRYICNAYKTVIDGDANYAVSSRHCIMEDIIEKSNQPTALVPQAASNYVNAVIGTGVELLDPFNKSLVRGSAISLVASNRDDFLLIKIAPGVGWDQIPELDFAKPLTKAQIGERAYMYGGGYSPYPNKSYVPHGVTSTYLGPVYFDNFYYPSGKARYDAFGIPDTKAGRLACLSGNSGTVAGSASGAFSGGLAEVFYIDPKFKTGIQYKSTLALPKRLKNQIENVNGISTKSFGRVCLSPAMDVNAVGVNLTLETLKAGEANLVPPKDTSEPSH
jgi:hypothetical protein